MTEQEYQNKIFELETQVQILERRLAGHRDAVVRWRQKAQVDPPSDDIELHKSEIYLFKDEWYIRESYIIPVEKTPALALEAWIWIIERDLLLICERVIFDLRRGWIAIFTKPWRP